MSSREMPGHVVFRTKNGPVAARVVRNPHPDIEVSENVLHQRDGNRNPSEGDRMQIVVDSRGNHRAVVPSGEESTHHYAEHEVVSVTESRDRDGTRRRRYKLRRTEAD